MPPRSAILVFSLLFSSGHGLFSDILRTGPRTANCRDWSSWSACYDSTQNIEEFLANLPEDCSKNSFMSAMIRLGGPMIPKFMEHTRRLNNSAGACGMCDIRLSCSRSCQPQNGGNRFGLSDQVCSASNSACAVKASEALDVRTGICQAWPPLRQTKADFFPSWIPETIQNMAWSLKPVNCINVNQKCFCCCAPLFPDPCTAKCVENPCSKQLIYTSRDLRRLRG